MVYSTLHKAPHAATTDPRRGQEIDSTLLRSLGTVTYRPGQAVWCGAKSLPLGFLTFFFAHFFRLYIRGIGGGAGGYAVNVTVLFSPSCALLKAYLSSPLFLTQRAQTHSHGQLPFNSQLGIRKLECWGELHKKNINVNKKAGTCVAISCHPTKC